MVANVGDSRGVLCQDGRAVPMSDDHKPNRPDERRRIELAGGMVVTVGVARVGGILAVSRAIGDSPLKQFVPATPEYKVIRRDPSQKFIILATDGLWDVVSNQEVTFMLLGCPLSVDVGGGFHLGEMELQRSWSRRAGVDGIPQVRWLSSPWRLSPPFAEDRGTTSVPW
ncbi:hypothetical protein GUITHDRAFT_83052 [Guillardia theta CCMP2712]|uniref:PPM-type phosphatase domain-containing protein n=1 Tax=Guillardia theta (strain CCMP2712) TaxID=905079 RepID=L1I6M9_GUITC|nr:hypothetical protein GUITHDRAFT_83052 [Guillardia theta CCMP2712]EKX31539.1 hypothetical protein GUITHDRAFT_83052 [Guillardia theta CCMP2712]|eukprot:XP_005818519.1 hypothetical protein GUITHDRAFT_83052 [Guillardia theta CCMP2712]